MLCKLVIHVRGIWRDKSNYTINQKLINKSNLIQKQCNYDDGCKYNWKGAIAVRKTIFTRQ